MRVIKLSKKAVVKTAKMIEGGGVVVFPTDTVYGFLADAENKAAVEKIYKIKKRPRSNPLPVFVKDIKMAKSLAEISEKQAKFLSKRWPGKYTFVLKSQIPNPNAQKLYGVKKDTIALRVPKYEPLNDLLKKINRPLAQTSANVSGGEILNSADKIIKIFGKQKNQPDLIVNAGNLPKRKPSTIIDLMAGKKKFLRK